MCHDICDVSSYCRYNRPRYTAAMHHAYVIAASTDEGMATALKVIERELGLDTTGNPDVMVLRHGLLSIEEVRKTQSLAMQAPLRGESKALVIAAERLYHESQNALLKLFEEPPQGTYLFLVVPSLGMLLPTLRSRVQVLGDGAARAVVQPEVAAFLSATSEKRAALIKKLSTGRDEAERRANRDRALAIVNGIEAALYAKNKGSLTSLNPVLLRELMTLRDFLHDRSAPVKMILEHLSLVVPNGLSADR